MSIIDRKSQAWEHTNARTRSESVISQISTCHSTIPPDVTTVQVENGWQKFQDDDISVPLDDEIELGPKFSRGWPSNSNCPCSTCDLVMSLN